MKRILITGANKGIGLATVRKLLDSYDETFLLLGSRDLKKGQEAFDSLVDRHPEWKNRLELIQIDVEKEDSVNSAVDEVRKKFSSESSPLYGIINNAGIGNSSGLGLEKILQVNTYGIKRVCDAFIQILNPSIGHIANVTSASGPVYLAGCREEVKELLTNPAVTWIEIEDFMKEHLKDNSESEQNNFQISGMGEAYGISKACANAYTICLARENPNLTINACTPGFIETDLTRPMAESNGKTPAEMGMKTPEEGTSASIFLLMGNPIGTGHYYGSDCVRSPFDRYRSPGDPPHS